MKKPQQSGNKLKLVIISGYWDPLHSGHLAYINAARKIGDLLFVIVNNDHQSKLKKQKSFLDEETRVDIISNLKSVDLAIKSIDKDRSVSNTLKIIYLAFYKMFDIMFLNGADANIDNILEKDICKKLNIKMKFNVGGSKKIDSSSEIIKRYRKNVGKLCEKK